MHGLVLLDAAGEVLRPSLIWCDQRTGDQCAAIEATIGRRRLIELTANPALTGFTLPKIWWVREHEPEIWKRTRSVLLPKDYVRYCLTGERATDVSDASGTLMLDVANRKWSAEMLAASQISENVAAASFRVAGNYRDNFRSRRSCLRSARGNCRWWPAQAIRPAVRWEWASCAREW